MTHPAIRSLFTGAFLLVATGLGAQDFIRGDATGEGFFNLDDSVFLVSYLYSDGPAPGVLAAGDVNDNGGVELGDITYLLKFLYLGGPVPSSPWPFPGPDPTPTPFDPPVDPTIELTLPNLNVVPGALGLELPLLLSNALTTNGIEVSITFDPTAVVLDSWDVSNSILGFANAEYINQEISNDPANPFAWLTAIVDFATPIDGHFVPAGDGLPIAVLHLSVPITATAPQTTQLAFTDGVDTPPKHNLVVVNGGETRRPTTSGGSIDIEVTFVRGDSNHDCMLDVSDPVYSVTWLFSGGPGHPCEDSADTNNDGVLNLADPIYLLNYLFQQGPSPSEPFPLAGLDPDQDSLDCAQQASCAGPPPGP